MCLLFLIELMRLRWIHPPLPGSLLTPFRSRMGLQGLCGGFDLNPYYLVSPLFGMGVWDELEGIVFIFPIG